MTEHATSEYKGDAGSGDCGAIGDTGEYLGLGVTERNTLEYMEDA